MTTFAEVTENKCIISSGDVYCG